VSIQKDAAIATAPAQDSQRRAIAYYACWVCIVGSLVSALLIVSTAAWALLVGATGVFLVGAIGLLLLRHNREAAVYRLVAIGGWLVIMIEPALTNGLFSVLLTALPIVLLLAAWLLGKRVALWLGMATLPIILLYAWGHAAGYVTGTAGLAASSRAVILAIIAAAATAVGYFAARTLGNQLDDLQAARNELERNLFQLAKRDEQLSLITERVPAMIAQFDAQEHCRFANAAYARFHGWSAEDIIGLSGSQIVGEEAYRDILPGVRRAMLGEPNQQVVRRTNEAGETRSLAVELVPSFARNGDVNGWYALIRDVTDTERTNRAMRHIVEGTARVTGTDFFRALAQNLAQGTGLACAMVAELLPGRRRARALAYWTGGEFREGVEYELTGAPCEQVLEAGEACYQDRVAELFPHDAALAKNGWRSYYGLRLDALDGTPMGLLVVMDRQALRRREEIASLVSIFAARAAAEMERIRAEAESRRSAEQFARVFQNSPVPIAISRLSDGRFRDINPAYEEIFGWRREEIIGRTSLEIGLWANAEARKNWVAGLGASGRRQEVETTFFNRRGEERTVLLSADTIELDGVPHILNFVYDQTERKRAEEEKRLALERFEGIFQNTPNVAIQGFDAQGKVMHWNRASENIYGIAADEALGQPLQSLLHTPDTAREFTAVLAEICSRKHATEPAEWPVPLRDGRRLWVLSTMFPVFSNGELVEIFSMDVDITALKHATDAAREINIALEARVDERTAELAELNRELESFSYSVSHDLRAPLRSIQGFGSILEERCGKQLTEEGRDYLQRMVRAAQRLAQLIDDLLELTRITRAELAPVNVDLSSMAREIVDELRHGSPERDAEVSIEDGLSVRGDPRLLRVALQNLLDNAWKYSAKAKKTRIEFGKHRDLVETAYYVRDHGAGFDMAYADKLFTPFQRLHNPRDFEGTGIGLATVARVVHRHGGRVWARSEPGKGAEFSFTLGR